MGWVTLTARKQSLRRSISNYEMRDLALSREIRSYHRNATYEQTILKSNKAVELREAKNIFDAVKDDRPEDKKSEEYNEWYMDYQQAREDYEAEKLEISELYDDQLAMLEEEAQEEQTRLDEERTMIESQMEAMRAEFDVVKEQISKEIEDSTIKL